MWQPTFHHSIMRENRLLAEKEAGFWQNFRSYTDDLGETYISDSVTERDPIKMATGVVMLPASLILEGTDQIYAALVGQKYQKPSGPAGRIVRDTKLLAKDVFTGHPLRAIGDAFRVVTADWILDAGDLLGGHHMHEGIRSNALQTRGRIAGTLVPEKHVHGARRIPEARKESPIRLKTTSS